MAKKYPKQISFGIFLDCTLPIAALRKYPSGFDSTRRRSSAVSWATGLRHGLKFGANKENGGRKSHRLSPGQEILLKQTKLYYLQYSAYVKMLKDFNLCTLSCQKSTFITLVIDRLVWLIPKTLLTS